MENQVILDLATGLSNTPVQIPASGELGAGKAYGRRAKRFIATERHRSHIQHLQPPRCPICGINI